MTFDVMVKEKDWNHNNKVCFHNLLNVITAPYFQSHRNYHQRRHQHIAGRSRQVTNSSDVFTNFFHNFFFKNFSQFELLEKTYLLVQNRFSILSLPIEKVILINILFSLSNTQLYESQISISPISGVAKCFFFFPIKRVLGVFWYLFKTFVWKKY